jgi:hypothetical protein
MGHSGQPCPWPQVLQEWEKAGKDLEMDEEDAQAEKIAGTAPVTMTIMIVHSTGVFTHNVLWCHCPGSDHQQHSQLLKAGLFPASISRPRTAFTFDILDHFLIDALECKTSAMSFLQKLHRLTNNASPDSVPVRHVPVKLPILFTSPSGSVS